MRIARYRGRRSRHYRRTRSLTPVLNVSARSRKRPRVDVRLAMTYTAIPVGIVLVLAAFFFGVRLIGASLFSHNTNYTIRHVDIQADDPVARDYLQGKRGIRKDANLFAFDIQDVCRDFLRLAPNCKGIRITRELPDTVRIAVTPREPLARLGRRGVFSVDEEGQVFGQRHRQGLPVILGYKGPVLKPGERVNGLAADGVSLIDAWNRIDLEREMPIGYVDVSGNFRGAADALQVGIEGELLVDIRWKRSRGRGDPPDDLRDRILFLRDMVARARVEGRRLREVDLTLDDFRNKNAARYW